MGDSPSMPEEVPKHPKKILVGHARRQHHPGDWK